MEIIEYDSKNNIINQFSHGPPEDQYNLILLNNDKTALIKYNCDKIACDGDEYNGKWELTNNTLRITINREELNSLADGIFLEAEIFRINTTELILEKISYSPTLSIAK